MEVGGAALLEELRGLPPPEPYPCARLGPIDEIQDPTLKIADLPFSFPEAAKVEDRRCELTKAIWLRVCAPVVAGEWTCAARTEDDADMTTIVGEALVRSRPDLAAGTIWLGLREYEDVRFTRARPEPIVNQVRSLIIEFCSDKDPLVYKASHVRAYVNEMLGHSFTLGFIREAMQGCHLDGGWSRGGRRAVDKER